jgi:hypothetical protein
MQNYSLHSLFVTSELSGVKLNLRGGVNDLYSTSYASSGFLKTIFGKIISCRNRIFVLLRLFLLVFFYNNNNYSSKFQQA